MNEKTQEDQMDALIYMMCNKVKDIFLLLNIAEVNNTNLKHFE